MPKKTFSLCGLARKTKATYKNVRWIINKPEQIKFSWLFYKKILKINIQSTTKKINLSTFYNILCDTINPDCITHKHSNTHIQQKCPIWSRTTATFRKILNFKLKLMLMI